MAEAYSPAKGRSPTFICACLPKIREACQTLTPFPYSTIIPGNACEEYSFGSGVSFPFSLSFFCFFDDFIKRNCILISSSCSSPISYPMKLKIYFATYLSASPCIKLIIASRPAAFWLSIYFCTAVSTSSPFVMPARRSFPCSS